MNNIRLETKHEISSSRQFYGTSTFIIDNFWEEKKSDNFLLLLCLYDGNLSSGLVSKFIKKSPILSPLLSSKTGMTPIIFLTNKSEFDNTLKF